MSEERAERNQVFTGGDAPVLVPPKVDPRIQSTTAAEKAKTDFGLDIPHEVVPLPSAGRVYPPRSPLHGLETIEIKSMTAREEDILTSAAFMKKGTIITELIKSCLVDRSIDPMEMLIGDRNALMVAIRITGYTADYDTEVECNECGTATPRTFNLAELPIRRLDIDPVEEGTNLFEFKLPKSGKVVRFRFMTGKDEQEIMATTNKQKKLGIQTEATVTTHLLYSIVSIDGSDDRLKISNFVKMMPALDSLSLRNYIRDHEPGMIMRQEVACPQCGESEEVGMPMGATFLWPNAR